MAKVTGGFRLGTSEGLTFYMMEGQLYVRMKSTLSRRRVKYGAAFTRTMQHAGELARASRVASSVYRELSMAQRRLIYVLYKKMTGVVKKAFGKGLTEVQAEREVRKYLVEMGVVKRERAIVFRRKPLIVRRVMRSVFVVFCKVQRAERKGRKVSSIKVAKRVNGPPAYRPRVD